MCVSQIAYVYHQSYFNLGFVVFPNASYDQKEESSKLDWIWIIQAQRENVSE